MFSVIKNILYAIISGIAPSLLTYIFNFLKTFPKITLFWISLVELFFIGFLLYFVVHFYREIKKLKKLIEKLKRKPSQPKKDIRAMFKSFSSKTPSKGGKSRY